VGNKGGTRVQAAAACLCLVIAACSGSSGSPKRTVPNVVGQNYLVAQNRLKAAGLNVKTEWTFGSSLHSHVKHGVILSETPMGSVAEHRLITIVAQR
jgi:beta-lactam-binding protein with PASTA domain